MMPKSSQNSLSKSTIEANSPVQAPDIGFNPEDAFYPLRIDPSDKKIKPSYQYQECVKRFLICLKWEKKTLYFDDLDWFFQNSFGLKKMERP